MQIGMVGLGKMGANMAERLRRGGHEVIGYDRDPEASEARSLADLAGKLAPRRAVWTMVPAGDPTEDTIRANGYAHVGPAGAGHFVKMIHNGIEYGLLQAYAEGFELPNLEKVRGYVEDSGEGRWTLLEAIEEEVPAPITALSLFARFASRQQDSFSMKLVAALRQQFGGHAVRER